MDKTAQSFMSALVKESSEEVSFEQALALLSAEELEKIAGPAPTGFFRGLAGKAMHYGSVAPLKTIGAIGGAAYGGLKDPGIDPMTGQPNTMGRVTGALGGALAGAAVGKGLQMGTKALRGMSGGAGRYLRGAQAQAAIASPYAADIRKSFADIRAGGATAKATRRAAEDAAVLSRSAEGAAAANSSQRDRLRDVFGRGGQAARPSSNPVQAPASAVTPSATGAKSAVNTNVAPPAPTAAPSAPPVSAPPAAPSAAPPPAVLMGPTGQPLPRGSNLTREMAAQRAATQSAPAQTAGMSSSGVPSASPAQAAPAPTPATVPQAAPAPVELGPAPGAAPAAQQPRAPTEVQKSIANPPTTASPPAGTSASSAQPLYTTKQLEEMGMPAGEAFQMAQEGMAVHASVDFDMLAKYMRKTAAGPTLLAKGVEQITKGGRGIANYLHSSGPAGVALGGAGFGAVKNLVAPGTDEYGQERGRLGAALGGAAKWGLGGAALGHGVKHFNPAIQGTTTWGKNLENVYGGAKSSVKGAIEKVFPKTPAAQG